MTVHEKGSKVPAGWFTCECEGLYLEFMQGVESKRAPSGELFIRGLGPPKDPLTKLPEKFNAFNGTINFPVFMVSGGMDLDTAIRKYVFPKIDTAGVYA